MYIYVVHRTQDVMYFPAFVIVHGFIAVLKVMFVEYMCSQGCRREGAVEYEIDLFFNIEKPKQGQPCLQQNKIICSTCYFTQELNFIECGMNYNQNEVTTVL